MVGWLRQGVGALIRQACLRVMELLMEEEVRERLGSYEMFHRGEPLTETVWEKLMLGLSTRKYGRAVREFAEAYGLEKSTISEHFIEASREKLKEMMERRLDKIRLCALLITRLGPPSAPRLHPRRHPPSHAFSRCSFEKRSFRSHAQCHRAISASPLFLPCSTLVSRSSVRCFHSAVTKIAEVVSQQRLLRADRARLKLIEKPLFSLRNCAALTMNRALSARAGEPRWPVLNPSATGRTDRRKFLHCWRCLSHRRVAVSFRSDGSEIRNSFAGTGPSGQHRRDPTAAAPGRHAELLLSHRGLSLHSNSFRRSEDEHARTTADTSKAKPNSLNASKQNASPPLSPFLR